MDSSGLKDNFLVKKKTSGATGGKQGREGKAMPLSRKSDMVDGKGMRWRMRFYFF